MTKKSPAEILIAYWEKEYIADKELQRRYDGYKQNAQHYQDQVSKSAKEIQSLQKDMEVLKDLIVDNACAGELCKSINDRYIHICEGYNAAVIKYKGDKQKLEENTQHIKQLENLSNHKKSVMYNMLVALEPAKYNIKATGIGYPEWSAKYKDNII